MVGLPVGRIAIGLAAMMGVIVMAIAHIDADADTAHMHTDIGSRDRKGNRNARACQKGRKKRAANYIIHLDILSPTATGIKKVAMAWVKYALDESSGKPQTLDAQ